MANAFETTYRTTPNRMIKSTLMPLTQEDNYGSAKNRHDVFQSFVILLPALGTSARNSTCSLKSFFTLSFVSLPVFFAAGVRACYFF